MSIRYWNNKSKQENIIYSIQVSKSFISQGIYSPIPNEFDTRAKAYSIGVQKYGSGTYELFINGTLVGWQITERIKINSYTKNLSDY